MTDRESILIQKTPMGIFCRLGIKVETFFNGIPMLFHTYRCRFAILNIEMETSQSINQLTNQPMLGRISLSPFDKTNVWIN